MLFSLTVISNFICRLLVEYLDVMVTNVFVDVLSIL